MQQSVGVGIIGVGFIGRTHISAFMDAQRDGHPCRLVAVCDRNEQRRSDEALRGAGVLFEAAGPNGQDRVVRSYASAAALLEDAAVDAVCICTHTDSHVDLAMEALRAGKHVLIEKPVSLRSSEAARLDTFARATGLRCVPAMCMRHWPGWRWLKDCVAAGTFGRARSARFERVGAAPGWAPRFFSDLSRSGGALFDLHIHDVDVLRWCFGEPSAVCATGSPSHVTTLYRFPGGPEHAVAEGGWMSASAFPFRMRYTVEFDRGVADFDVSRDPSLQVFAGSDVWAPELPDLSGYEAQARHFVDCVADPSHDPVASLSEAAAVLRVLEAERESLARGAEVRLDRACG